MSAREDVWRDEGGENGALSRFQFLCFGETHLYIRSGVVLRRVDIGVFVKRAHVDVLISGYGAVVVGMVDVVAVHHALLHSVLLIVQSLIVERYLVRERDALAAGVLQIDAHAAHCDRVGVARASHTDVESSHDGLEIDGMRSFGGCVYIALAHHVAVFHVGCRCPPSVIVVSGELAHLLLWHSDCDASLFLLVECAARHHRVESLDAAFLAYCGIGGVEAVFVCVGIPLHRRIVARRHRDALQLLVAGVVAYHVVVFCQRSVAVCEHFAGVLVACHLYDAHLVACVPVQREGALHVVVYAIMHTHGSVGASGVRCLGPCAEYLCRSLVHNLRLTAACGEVYGYSRGGNIVIESARTDRCYFRFEIVCARG